MFGKRGDVSSRHVRVAAIDSEVDFIGEVFSACKRLDIHDFFYARSPQCAETVFHAADADILILELNDRYEAIWNEIRRARARRPVVVASTYDRSAKSWVPALRAGAERVIVKQQAASAVEPMLMHLIHSEAARRFRVVPLRRVPLDGAA